MSIEQNQVEQMRKLLYTKATAPAEPKKVATLRKKDDEIDVTDEVIDILTKPITEKALKDLKPILIETIDKVSTERAEETESKLADTLKEAMTAQTTKVDQTLAKALTETAKAVTELTELAHQVRPIEIRTENNTYTISGVQHSKFENLLKIIGSRLPVFMVGPAGTGKTAAAANAATALGLDFYAMSVGSQTSKSDIFGYKDATGGYHSTAFRDAYENGGVFLLDEADAGNANVLVGLNAALSNGYVYFPDKRIQMHNNFRMVATANTFGNGASRQYVGRNQLDAATLDRFVVITWDIDPHIENALAVGSDGQRWLKVVRAVREQAIDELELRVVVSPRATLRGSTLLDAGLTFEDTLEVALIANMPEAERGLLRNTAIAVWEKGTPKKRASKRIDSEPVVDLDALKAVYNEESF